MRFGLAECEHDGWLLRSEVTFSDQGEAISVAKEWASRRGQPTAVADIAESKLVWRLDGGDLALPYRGTKRPSVRPSRRA